MRGVRGFIAVLSAWALAFSAGAALASPYAMTTPKRAMTAAAQAAQRPEGYRTVRGEVTAVEPDANPPTLVVEAMRGKEKLTVGVDVTDKTVIRQGKSPRTLADIKVGDRVRMKYAQTSTTLVADEITILKPAPMATTR